MSEAEPSQNGTPEVVIEEVDVEEYARNNRLVPHAKRYVIRIDKERRVVHTPVLTGKLILELVGKTPDKFKLYEHFHGRQPSIRSFTLAWPYFADGGWCELVFALPTVARLADPRPGVTYGI